MATGCSDQVWDLWTPATRLDDCQHVFPTGPCLLSVIADTQFQTYLLASIREDQELDPVTADLKHKLANPNGPPPSEHMLYQLHDGVLVVPEPDGQQRLVVPSTSLYLIHKFLEDNHYFLENATFSLTFRWNVLCPVRSEA